MRLFPGLSRSRDGAVVGFGMARSSSATGGAVRPAPASRHPLRVGLLAVCVGVLALRLTVITPMTVDGHSMEPRLRDDDVVLVRQLPRSAPFVEREDLVVFEDTDGTLSLKRVVGLAGDEVAIRDGVLQVDGVVVARTYIDHETVDGLYFGPVTVPPRTVFVLGDNLDNSVDSRDVGAVGVDRLVGRVLTRLWPPRW